MKSRLDGPWTGARTTVDRMTMMSEDDNKNNGSRGNNQSICIDFLPLVLLLFLPPFRMLMVIVDAPIILLFIHLQHPRTVPDSSLCRPPANHQSNSPQTTMDTTYRHPFIRPVCDPNPRVVLALSHYQSSCVVSMLVVVVTAAPASVLRTVKDSGTFLGENISSPQPPSIRFGNYC